MFMECLRNRTEGTMGRQHGMGKGPEWVFINNAKSQFKQMKIHLDIASCPQTWKGKLRLFQESCMNSHWGVLGVFETQNDRIRGFCWRGLTVVDFAEVRDRGQRAQASGFCSGIVTELECFQQELNGGYRGESKEGWI